MSIKRTDALRVAVLASGRGSNLQAVIDAIEAGTVQAKIVAVISNKKEAPALERARRHGLSGPVRRSKTLFRTGPIVVRPTIGNSSKCFDNTRWSWYYWPDT